MLNFQVCNNENEIEIELKLKWIAIRKGKRGRVVYHSRGNNGRLEVQIIHSKPIFRDVEVISVCPIENTPRNTGTCTMDKDEDTMIIEVRFCKYKKTLIIWFRELVPSKNIGGDVGHRQILGNVSEEQVDALVSSIRGIHRGSIYTNLQMKLHEKTRRKERSKPKEIKLRIDESKYTNLGNELLDAGICGEGASGNLGIEHYLNHVHFQWGKTC
jgi:hypothetical protein